MDRGSSEFEKIVVEDIPLIDVRAPVEFASGAIPGARNLPILDDQQRHRVGKCHRERGPEEAVALGYKLVSKEVKEERVQGWLDLLEKFPEACLYCSRGGMRSEIACQWILDSTGKSVVRLQGGYKAFRTYLLEHLQPESLKSKPIILGGRTGSGKTRLLAKLENGIDLEELAHHRGSSFGRFITPQPGQADFENRLACSLIKHEAKSYSHVILEDEGRHVGKRFLPKELTHYFSTGGLVILETPLNERTENTFTEYVVVAQAGYQAEYGQENGLEQWLGEMLRNVDRIGKRLGGSQLRQVRKLLEQAHADQLKSGSAELHKKWLKLLLSDYYDPMYDYQIQKKSSAIVFTGNAEAVLEFLQTKK